MAEATDGVRNDPEHERFVFPADDTFGAVYYRLAPGIITYTHTEVPPEIGGRGIANQPPSGIAFAP